MPVAAKRHKLWSWSRRAGTAFNAAISTGAAPAAPRSPTGAPPLRIAQRPPVSCGTPSAAAPAVASMRRQPTSREAGARGFQSNECPPNSHRNGPSVRFPGFSPPPREIATREGTKVAPQASLFVTLAAWTDIALAVRPRRPCLRSNEEAFARAASRQRAPRRDLRFACAVPRSDRQKPDFRLSHDPTCQH
jgi:hypothetical protein